MASLCTNEDRCRRCSTQTKIGPDSRIAVRADRALKPSNAFNLQPAVPGFVPSNLPGGRSWSRRRICGRNEGAEPGVPGSPDLRNRNSTGARAHAARYVVNSTPHGQVRFEPAQLRVAAAPFRSSSRWRPEIILLRPHACEQEFGRCGRHCGPLQHSDLPLLGADLTPHAGDLVADPVELHNTPDRRARRRICGSAWRRRSRRSMCLRCARTRRHRRDPACRTRLRPSSPRRPD